MISIMGSTSSSSSGSIPLASSVEHMSGQDSSKVADNDFKCCAYLPEYIYDQVLFLFSLLLIPLWHVFSPCGAMVVRMVVKSMTLVQSQTPRQLLDGAPWNFEQTLMDSRRWSPDDFSHPSTFPLVQPTDQCLQLITRNVFISTRWIGTDFGTYFHVPTEKVMLWRNVFNPLVYPLKR